MCLVHVSTKSWVGYMSTSRNLGLDLRRVIGVVYGVHDFAHMSSFVAVYVAIDCYTCPTCRVSWVGYTTSLLYNPSCRAFCLLHDSPFLFLWAFYLPHDFAFTSSQKILSLPFCLSISSSRYVYFLSPSFCLLISSSRYVYFLSLYWLVVWYLILLNLSSLWIRYTILL